MNFFRTFKVRRQRYQNNRLQGVRGENNLILIFFYPRQFFTFVCLFRGQQQKGGRAQKQAAHVLLLTQLSAAVPQADTGHKLKMDKASGRSREQKATSRLPCATTPHTTATHRLLKVIMASTRQMQSTSSHGCTSKNTGLAASSHKVVWLEPKMKFILF